MQGLATQKKRSAHLLLAACGELAGFACELLLLLVCLSVGLLAGWLAFGLRERMRLLAFAFG